VPQPSIPGKYINGKRRKEGRKEGRKGEREREKDRLNKHILFVISISVCVNQEGRG
jgi:hypothetical protein